MLNVLRFISLILVLPTLLWAQGEDMPIVKSFGEPGEVGSFRVGFSEQTAGIVWLQATDHYRSLEAAKNSPRTTADYLLLVDNGNHALRLFQAPNGVFAKDPSTSVWEMEDVTNGVKFTLAFEISVGFP